LLEVDKIRKVIEAAKLYYELDYSQNQIADAMGVSRPTVSRMLQQAKAEGIVTIEIHDPTEDVERLKLQLKEKFGLRHAVIAYAPTDEDGVVKQYIAQAAADYLDELVKDGDVIGASWGSTMHQVALHLKPKPLKNAFVVQLNGGVADADVRVSPSEIVHLFAKAFGVIPYFMYLPAIVDHTLVKQAMQTDRHIRKVMDIGKRANIAVFTAGIPSPDSLLVNSNYFREEELEMIKEQAVGDICSRYFDREGNICIPSLNERTLGIELADLRQKEHTVLVAGGAEKANAIIGALKGRYANTLVTDKLTARLILEKMTDRRNDR
jgi:deoxyribonucleoside regulator